MDIILSQFKYDLINDEKYADFSLSLLANYKIPWLFPDSEKDWNFPDFSLTGIVRLSSAWV